MLGFREFKFSEKDTETDIHEATVTAFAEAIAQAYEDGEDHDCHSEVTRFGETPNNSGECFADASVLTSNVVKDAIVQACALLATVVSP